MQTPKDFQIQLRMGIITTSVAELAVYSVNKRAKNCRDKKQEYYYRAKNIGQNRYVDASKWFDTVDNYKAKEAEYYTMKTAIIEGLGINPLEHHVINGDEHYLYYVIGEHSFHQPVDPDDPRTLDIPQKELTDFHTIGHQYTELLSVQFVKKLIDIINSGNFKYIEQAS